MRYLPIVITIGFAGIASGCTTSYLGGVSSYEPGFVYAGYGPAYLESSPYRYGFSPRAAVVRNSRLPATDLSGR